MTLVVARLGQLLEESKRHSGEGGVGDDMPWLLFNHALFTCDPDEACELSITPAPLVPISPGGSRHEAFPQPAPDVSDRCVQGFRYLANPDAGS
jgi:hypothetical protein